MEIGLTWVQCYPHCIRQKLERFIFQLTGTGNKYLQNMSENQNCHAIAYPARLVTQGREQRQESSGLSTLYLTSEMHYNTQVLLELKLYDDFAAGTSQGLLQYKCTSRQLQFTSFQPAGTHQTPVTFHKLPQMLLISARAKYTSHKLPQVLLISACAKVTNEKFLLFLQWAALFWNLWNY